ncbi:pseudouridine synthase, partial [Pavlovales sp. CCMP2436]
MRFATALLVAYDGSRGWAWDSTIRTALADVLTRIVREPVTLEAASRTDAGVHARGQLACFFTEKPPLGGNLQLLRYRVNQMLPDDLVLRKVAAAPSDYDVRTNGGKIYRYHLDTNSVADP